MNYVDIAVIVVLLASGVLALMRGVVHEVLSVAGWVVAALAAFWSLPLVRPLLGDYITNPTLADIAGGAAVFVVVLVVSSMLTHAVARTVQGSALGSIDRSLGFLFGIVRGIALVSLCFLAVTKLMAPDEPEILASAKTRPLMATGARMIQSLLPGDMSEAESRAREASERVEQARQIKEMYDRLQAPSPRSDREPGKSAEPPSYDSRGLERLIETNK